MGTFSNSEDPDEMLHIAFTLFAKEKKIFGQKNTIFYENSNLKPLDVYNGLSQVYGIKPEERIH